MFSLKAMIKPQAIPVVAAALRELRIPGMSARDIGRMKVRNANMCNVEKEAHNAHKVRLEVVVTDEQKRVTEKAIMAAVAESGQLAVGGIAGILSERDVAVSLGASILGSSRAMQPRLTKLIQDGWVEVSVEPIWSPTGTTTTTWLRRFSS